ncbi:SusC/RagA family TonB-linked outer membrane protein [Chitinophaga sancti]|uniref:SusC/RagA family TonB-linked outer membrane protein n=1 Tax=Chitinophaga sancti TaxID=1004 RepID=A0A1K1SG76_9BACT|nr:SusC/RagA family TonB-linked outer membrane protein [Chitinophaga sancti]WQD59875.1 SusC/RagA family TonB-linked outer membrane protein [Chitinophaga sancti]WQG87994.1 SusC/RagA family TonB-linked outer membrane protein [Chitinophaga sancti]SFW83384.1 TonB-linked outer membrane protein, SusC/RagA family [Chitinophaga sancti]
MKGILTIVYCFLFCNQLKAQLIDLDLQGQYLSAVKLIIHTKTRCNLTIDRGISQAVGPIYFKCSRMPLKDALKKMLNEDLYAFTIEGNSVHIERRTFPQKNGSSLLPDSTALRDLRGIVVDTANRPLPGATIFIKSRKEFSVASNDGTFKLSGVTMLDTVMISYMGYETRNFVCSEGVFLKCILLRIYHELEPFSSKGYYSVPRKLNPGRVSGIKARDIQGQPVSDPLMALDGRSAGVTVSPGSGIAGSFIGVNVEGINSMANGNSPLFIVDGVPLAMSIPNQLPNAAGSISSMQLLQPENIESVDVLKDADASAIYGSRGANGIILVKTKRPAAGKTSLNMMVYSGQGKITRGLKLMNTQQYLAMRHEALRNDTLTPGMNDYDLTRWDTTRYTDWQKTFLGGHSNVLNASGTLSGGNQQTQFSFGGGYRRETAVFSHNFASTTLSADMSVLHVSEDKKTNIDIGLHYMNNDNQLPVSDITPKVLLAPNAPSLFTASGDLNWEDTSFENPYGQFRQRYQALFNHFLGSFKLTYKLLPKLKLSANLGYNYIQLDERLVIPTSSMSPLYSSISAAREHRKGSNVNQSWIVEPQANYSLNLGNAQKIDLLAGITLQQSKQHQYLLVATNFESDALIENVSMATIKTTNTDENVYRYKGVYARLGYNYKDLLCLNFTGRHDGSSRFSAAKRSEFFGSAAAAWIFSNMPAFRHIPLISFGKVYANIGRTGNDQFSDYQFYDTYTLSTGYGGVPGLERTQLTNYLYKWEILIKSSVGIELCFNQRYTLAANYFRNHTRNQLIKYELPAITGYKYTTENLPAVVQNHGLELEFEAQQIQRENFRWEHAFNLTVPYNKLVYYPNIASSIYASIYEVGQPLNARFVYEFKGINPNTGIAEFKDVNQDLKVDKLDRTAKVIGPKFFAGWGNRFTYKRLSLDVFFQLVKQTGYYVPNVDLMPGSFSSSGGNLPLSNDHRWTKPGDEAIVQKYAAGSKAAEDAATQYNQSDASIVDASYIRLKNLSISWDLPLLWSTRVKIKSASLFLNSQNLATWTSYKGMDPQVQSFHSTYRQPPQRVIVAGLRISL